MQQALRSALAVIWLLLRAAVALGWGLPAGSAAAPADHLALTEIVVQTRVAGTTQVGSKYVEIVNPTDETIELTNVYLTDATFNSPPTYYYDIVRRGQAGIDRPGGGGTGGDFHARFPDGASLAPGDTLAVSIMGSTEYLAAYGRLPDFELYEEALVPDTVPEMVEVFPGSIGRGLGSSGTNTPDLNSGGETIVLYYWDGASDLVQDLDYAIWGTVTSVRVDKTGVTVDGPDADDIPSAYLPDTPTGSQQPIATSAHNFGGAYQRRAIAGLPDEGAEIQSGGNGTTGHDETSEPLAASWQVTTTQSPPAQPATLHPPAPIITAAAQSPAAPTAGQAVTVTATVLANDAVAGVRLYWAVAGGGFTEVSCANTSGNLWSGQIPGQSAQTSVAWYVAATNTGGASATRPVAAPIYTNSYTVGDEPPPPPDEEASLLLLTEVCVAGDTREFIEIWNPGSGPVDLSNYYLTDAIHSPGSQFYWRIVEPNPGQTTVGGGLFNDFHARFPAGAAIAAGDTVVISVPGSNAFQSVYGFLPDFELFEDGDGPDEVPDMREVFAGSIKAGTNPTLTNSGETVILYYWNGYTDLVTDIDIFFWRTPDGTSTSYFFTKTGVAIDGPDPDTTPSAYQPDTAIASQNYFPSSHAAGGESYQRVDAGEGTERSTGGNGVSGHDETSENLSVTWGVRTADPSRPRGTGPVGEMAGAALEVPARTFLPLFGQTFPVRFRTLRDAQTLVRVFDLDGRLVVTLFDSRFDGAAATAPGQFTQRSWNGRDAQMELVPAGLYVVQLSVVEKTSGKQHTKTAPAVVATQMSR